MFRLRPGHYRQSAQRKVIGCAWPVLGLMATALAGMLALEISARDAGDQSTGSAMSLQPSIPAAVPAAPGHGSVLANAATVLARLLFNQDRRPPANLAASGVHSPGSLPRLTGVVVASSARRLAIFANSEGKPIVAAEGDRIGGAVIDAITAGQVTMRGPAGIAVLHPTFGDNASHARQPDPPLIAKAGRQPHAVPLPASSSW